VALCILFPLSEEACNTSCYTYLQTWHAFYCLYLPHLHLLGGGTFACWDVQPAGHSRGQRGLHAIRGLLHLPALTALLQRMAAYCLGVWLGSALGFPNLQTQNPTLSCLGLCNGSCVSCCHISLHLFTLPIFLA